jgi:hypothetical protein
MPGEKSVLTTEEDFGAVKPEMDADGENVPVAED